MNPTDLKKYANDPKVLGLNARGGLAKVGGSAVVTPKPVATQTTPTTTAITADNLKPQKGAVITPPAIATEAPKLQADLEVQAEDAFTQAQTTARQTAEKGKTTALGDYIESLKNQKGLTSLQNDAYAQKGGVNDITPELNDINDQIRREQLANRRAQEAVMKNTGGGLKGGAQAEIANINRESLAKQADLSVIQMAVQGRYDSAKEIADRAVSAQMEQQNILNEALKFNYQENKELFTTAEQREFETLLGNRTRKIQEETDRLKEIKSFALQALQAGASVAEAKSMMNAKTLEEAMSIGGGYFRPKPVGTGSGAPKITEIDGKPFVWDATTGQYIPAGEYIKGGNVDTEQSNQIKSVLSLANELKSSTAVGKGSAVGASLAKFVPFGQSLGLQGSRTAFENKVNTLKANLTLDNLGLLKGPMSDKDLAFLQAVGSSLTTNMSEKEFDKELDKVIGKLGKAQGAIPQTPAISGYITTTPDGQQVEIID